MNYLRAQFRCLVQDPAEVEARSILAFTFAIGRHFLETTHDDLATGEVLACVAKLLGLLE